MKRLSRASPLGAIVRGFVAGVAGTAAQDLFFAFTRRWQPNNEGIFDPPEPQASDEQATQTVARRAVEGFMKRGPIRNKRRAGKLVHYGYGGMWGALYGLGMASYPSMATFPIALSYGAAVWMVSDNFIVPMFRLAAWPQRYPVRTHAYAIAAHLAYAAGTWAAFSLARKDTLVLGAIGWKTRKLPPALRRRVLKTALYFWQQTVAI